MWHPDSSDSRALVIINKFMPLKNKLEIASSYLANYTHETL